MVADFFAGWAAGLASTIVNTPFDVVKTRMQGIDGAKYKSTFQCAGQVWKQGGPLGFYSGFWPRLCGVLLDVGIVFSVYNSLELYVLQKIYGK